MPEQFGTVEELFEAARALVARLEACGQRDAASELQSGFGCLNGLTDGWAKFLEAIDWVVANAGRQLGPADKQALERLQAEVRRAVKRQ
ncbi:MAG: hypothetical protein HZB16_22595 [Armatimonadetes bacterium]|nr:hypothetical protein [Armatimonadota bacterium]